MIGLFSDEANSDAVKSMNNKMNYFDSKGEFIRGIHREGGLALYMLTRRPK